MRHRAWLRVVFAALTAGGSVAAAVAQEQDFPDTSDSSMTWTRYDFSRTRGWTFTPSAAFLYDSFGQRYEIADEDTLDLVDELSGNLVARLRRAGRTSVDLQNTFGYGEESLRNDFVATLRRRFAGFELRLEEDVRYKGYRQNSDFSLSSDYWINRSRALLVAPLPGSWRLRWDERFETTRVAERTRFNYDYHRLDHGLELQRNFGFLSELRFGYVFGTRSVPDSTAIDFQRHVVRGGWTQELGLHTLSLDHNLEVRYHGDSRVRSDYVDWQGDVSFNAWLSAQSRLRPAYRLWVVEYADPDSVYANGTEQSVELLIERDLTSNTTLGIGPRGEYRRTNSGFERSYNQWSVKGTISVLQGSRFWMQFTNEIGARKHLAGSTDSADFYTDYIFNWTTLYLSWKIVPKTTLDVFFSLTPESHEDAANNTTTLLLSSALTWQLR